MKVTKKDLANQEVELKISVAAEDLQKYEAKAAEKLAQKVEVKGFRKGKAPKDVLKKQVGEQVFMQYVLDEAVPGAYVEALQSEKVTPIARPKIEVTSATPLEFTATIALEPQVKLKSLEKIKIKREKVEVTKEELDGTIYELRKYQAKYTDVKRAAKKGDRVEIDFEGFDEKGETLDGTKSKNHPLVLGDGQFVPGFEDNVMGMKIGETKEFTVTFPKDYHRDDFKNKKVKFVVTVGRIEEMELPEITEELTEKILGKKISAKDFEAEIKTDIIRQKNKKEDQRQQAELFEKLVEKADIQISELLGEEELEYMLHQQRHDLEKRGIQWEQFMEMMKQQGRNIREERKVEAMNRVKARYIIRALIADKNLKVDDKEVLETLKDLGAPKEALKADSQAFMRTKDELMLKQIFDLFLEPAKEQSKPAKK